MFHSRQPVVYVAIASTYISIVVLRQRTDRDVRLNEETFAVATLNIVVEAAFVTP